MSGDTRWFDVYGQRDDLPPVAVSLTTGQIVNDASVSLVTGRLYWGWRGSWVAVYVEPATGEVMCMVAGQAPRPRRTLKATFHQIAMKWTWLTLTDAHGWRARVHRYERDTRWLDLLDLTRDEMDAEDDYTFLMAAKAVNSRYDEGLLERYGRSSPEKRPDAS